MLGGVSESRFYMWRAVFALAHIDRVVTDEEKALAGRYLESVPFSEEQKAVLRQDLIDAQDIEEMFEQIDDPADQSEFFGFARLMVWCDGDFDQQEEEIFDRIKGIQMERINPEALREMVQQSRGAFNLDRLKEEQAFEEQAKDLVSLKRLLKILEK
ncbi:MAG: TerB family tellurite resistance protein [Rhodospirillales bacterium]|nr:TerB family tellurite resistance protein [Alphaproteobacteria bacterium]MCB9981318.1 TerB family tellurite resistance protein [Rhodospirillales bacterium]